MNLRIVSTLLAAAALLAFLPAHPARAALGDCAQPVSTGANPTATDALSVLQAAVGSPSGCDTTPCICDIGGDGNTTATDALQVLQVAVGQPIALNCDCGACVTLPAASGSSVTRGNPNVAVKQVLIEVKLVGITSTSYNDLGLDTVFTMSTPITTDTGPALGGTNGDGRTLAVDTSAIGGPGGLQYLLYGMHRPEGALPILNINFISPFDAVKSFFPLPTDGCLLFSDQVVSEPQGFPGTVPVENLAPADAGYGGGQILYNMFDGPGTASLLAALESDNNTTVLTAPSLTAFSGQAQFLMVDDVEPALNEVVADFRSNIQAVTPNPLGVFTGITLDFVPTVTDSNGPIALTIRPGTEAASFFFSTAFGVDGNSADAEIPLLRRSLNRTSVTVASGQTVVLGGLLEQGSSTPTEGVPFIGDIPVIGTLFHKRFDPEQQKLLIFITPMLVQ